MILLIEDLVPNDYNPRKIFRGAAMEELKASIKKDGLIEPLVVRKLENGKYEVVCGMRRYNSLIDLKIPEVECMIRKLSDYNAMRLALLENIQRENLSAVEEGRMYKKLIDAKPSTKKTQNKIFEIPDSEKIKELSKEIKKSTEMIGNRISLLNLPIALQNAIENEKLKKSYAFQLARLPNHSLMEDFYRDITKYNWDIEELRKNVSKKIKQLKEKETKTKEQIENQINILKEKIKNIREVRKPLIDGLIDTIDKLKEIIIDEEEEIEIDLNNIGNLLNIVEEKLKFYEDNKRFQALTDDINKKEERISKIKSLISTALQLDIRVCPFCEAGIDINTLKENIRIHKEDLKKLNDEQDNISLYEENLKRLKENFRKYNEAILIKNKGIYNNWKKIIEVRKNVRNNTNKKSND